MTPPRWSRLLLRLSASASERALMLEETDAEFSSICVTGGVKTARRWYRQQARRSLVPLLAQRLRGGAIPRGAGLDLREALRNVVRHPGTSLTIVTTLGLASAAALATLVVVDGVLLSPLAFPDSGRIVTLWNTGPKLPVTVRAVSFQDVDDWRRLSKTLSSLSTFTPVSATLTGRGDARRLEGLRVGESFDRVMGVAPAFGRFLVTGDFHAGAEPVVMITNEFWRREFGGNPRVIDTSIMLNDRSHRIVGVLPPMATALRAPAHDYWTPLFPREGVRWEWARNTGWAEAIGRLAPSATLETAAAELSAIANQLATTYPDSNADRPGIAVESLQESIVGEARPALLLTAAATIALLVVAFGNVLHLVVAGVVARQSELSVRHALGASRGRLIRQSMYEAATLAAGSVGVALLLAPVMVQALDWLPAAAVPRRSEISVWPDGLPWASGLFGVITLLIAWPLTRAAMGSRLSVHNASLRTTGTRADRRTRQLLVATQTGLSVVLIVAGVLFVQTLLRLQSVGLGFSAEHMLTLQPTPSRAAAPNPERTIAFYQQAIDALTALPGVTHVAASTATPFVIGGWGYSVAAHDNPGGTRYPVQVAVASPGYFETLGIQLLEGRWLSVDEHRGLEAVVVNDRLASLLFGSRSAVGQTFEYSGRQWRVAGVAAGTRTRVADAPTAMLYLPWGMAGQRPQAILIRTASDLNLLDAARQRLKAIDPNVTVTAAGPLQDRVQRTLAPQRFRAGLLATLAALAAGLAVIGAYSITTFAVAAQRHEQAIRLTLGESVSDARRRVVWSSLRPAVAGIAFGLSASWYSSRFVTALLFESSPADPALLAVPLLMSALVAAAAFVPASRLAKLDPASLLRRQM